MNSTYSEPYQPRLPVYILIDCSGTMNQLMPTVRSSVNKIIEVLNVDFRSRENAYISVITFNDEAVSTPLTALPAFKAPPLTAIGKTQMGKALKALNASLDVNIVRKRQMPDGTINPGDYRPLVFIITDGEPSKPKPVDPEYVDWRPQAKLLLQRKHAPLHVVGLAIGADANVAILQEMTTATVMVTGDLAQLETALMQYFDWLADTVVATIDAYSTLHGATPVNPPPQFPETLTRAPASESTNESVPEKEE